ncbi:MAG TPA: CheR family methyltransferase [Polyangia bacterium]|jgi:chemotaxis protein methyltransferase CheR|nr:CheR family methyltransferase [Polyangia bacterium]
MNTAPRDYEEPPHGLEDLEIDLLLEGIARRYGSDLRGYARGALRHKLMGTLVAERLPTISALQERVLRDAAAMARVLATLATNVQGMFRDPGFFLTFRRRIVPLLRTYPFVRIWLAGCSTGEEVYSIAIVLAEEHLSTRVRLYATDMSETVLAQAKAGTYGADLLQPFETSYLEAGGRRTLTDYCTIGRDGMTLSSSLRDNVIFGQHDLATDRSFNEFNVILCRNVTIHFGLALRRRVHDLLRESLCRLGILGLGAHESLRGSGHEDRYEVLDPAARLFRRLG